MHMKYNIDLYRSGAKAAVIGQTTCANARA